MSLWDKYEAQYRRRTGSSFPTASGAGDDEGSSSLEEWSSGTERLMRDYFGGGIAPAKGLVTGRSMAPGDISSTLDSEWAQGRVSEAENLDAAAAVAEADGESIGEKAGGFLTGALDFLDRTRAAGTGYVSGVINMVGTGLEQVGVDNPLDEWTAETWNGQGEDYAADNVGDVLANSPWGRALRGISGNEKYGAGDFDGPLKFQDDDSGWERALKAGATFATEVGLDPLTYVTLGAGSVGKKVAAEGAEAVVKRTLTDVSDEAAEKIASRNSVYTGLRQAAEEGDDERVLGVIAGRLGKTADEARKEFGSGRAALEANRRLFAEDQFLDEFGQAILSRGGRGVRQFLEDTEDLTPEQAKSLWDSLDNEVKGGLRFSVPFTGKETPGLVGGLGGSLVDKAGLGKVADVMYMGRGFVSANPILNPARGAASGEVGKAWAAALAKSYEAARKGNTGSDGAYLAWSRLSKETRKNRSVSGGLSADSVAALSYAAKPIAALAKADREEAETLFKEYIHYPDRVPADDASAASVAAYQAAETLRKATAEKLQSARDAGMTIGEIDGYVTRWMTDEARKRRARATGEARRKSSGTSVQKSRENFQSLIGEAPDGSPIFRWDAVPDINKQWRDEHGYDLFEEDPMRLYASYFQAIDRGIASTSFLNGLRKAGLLVDAGSAVGRSVDGWKVREAVEDARASADVQARSALDRMLSTGAVKANPSEDELLEDGLFGIPTPDVLPMDSAMPRGVAEWLRALPDDDAVREQAVKELMDAVQETYRGEIDDLAEKLKTATGDEAQKLMDRRRKVEEKLADATVDSVMKTSQKATKVSDFFADEGWELLGAPGRRGKRANMILPAEAGEVEYVNKFARSIIESHFTPKDLTRFEEWTTPFLAAWKASATYGRGPGYHVRNATGAIWNNMLVGVRKEHYAAATKIRRAITAANKELAGRDFANAAEEQAALEALLRERLPEPLMEVYGAARNAGILDSTMRVEYMMRNGLMDANGIDYVSEAAMRDPRIMPNLRRNQRGRTDLFSFVPASERNKFMKGANAAINNPVYRFSADVGQMTEEYFRMAAFIRGADKWGLADGGDTAALMVKAAHFDYGDLSDVERRVLRFVMPFYVWTRNNVPLQMRALVTNPKYALTLERGQEALSGTFEDDSEYGQWLDENMPEWSKSRFAFPITIGDTSYSFGVESPVTDLNRMLAWSANPADQLDRLMEQGASGLSPVVKLPIESITGVDSFTGAPIEDTVDAPNYMRLLPFLTSTVAGETEPQMNGVLANFLKDAVPPLGMVENLVPVGQPERNRERLLSSWASTGLGLPMATLSENQVAGQIAGDSEFRRQRLKEWLGENYPGVSWEDFYELSSSGKYTPDQVVNWLQAQ